MRVSYLSGPERSQAFRANELFLSRMGFRWHRLSSLTLRWCASLPIPLRQHCYTRRLHS